MATAEQTKFFINFTGGLNTEATELNFPENSAQELDNFDLSRTGKITRRLGVEFEAGGILRPEKIPANEIDTYAVSTHEWRAVNGKGDTNFLVIQVGLKLYIHNLDIEPISGSLRATVDLGPYKVGPNAETLLMDTAFGEGIMIVANAHMETVILEFDESDGSFTATPILMETRDFDGIEESNTPADYRPLELTPAHLYNLRNQGWPLRASCNNSARGSRGISLGVDPVEWTRPHIGSYPSNADIFYAAKAAIAEDAEVVGSYSPWVLLQQQLGNTPAPKGHYILELFNQDRSTAANRYGGQFNTSFGQVPRGFRAEQLASENPITDEELVYTTLDGLTPLQTGELLATDKRPSVVAFYAGRVWYFGIPDKEYTGDIYFSQQLEDTKKAGKCYQDNDPTAETLNGLLATDGGKIHVADMGLVFWAHQVGQDLVIMSSTGVYAVAGESGANFQADGFTVRKITTENTVGKNTVIEAEGSLFWWSDGGIWGMTGSQITDELEVLRISKETIQGFYDNISPTARAYARGHYDKFSKKLYWFYNDTVGYNGIDFRYKYNRALVLDLTLQAWYPYTIPELDANSPFIASMFQKQAGAVTTVVYDLYVDADQVQEAGDTIAQSVAFQTYTDVKLKLLTFATNEDLSYSYTFSEFKNRSFTDWQQHDRTVNDVGNNGVSYDSVLQTGWNDFADPLREKYITHLTSFFERTEDGFELSGSDVVFSNPSGCFVEVRWEWTDQDVGQWSRLQQAYRLARQYVPEDVNDPFDYGYTVVSSKLRMRGDGKSFSIRYTSEAGKDAKLLGFAVNVKAPKKL